jgi:TetR/AcrR family transcriptional repressor of lmrAB and yxaGH operons
MAPRQNPRTIIGRLLDIFRCEGYDGATLTTISNGIGLGRASFYHHFPGGKSDMSRAAFDRASRDFTRAVLAPLAGTAPPAERLQGMVSGLDTFYDGGRGACLIDVFSMGGARDLFHEEISEAVAYWMEAIARVLVDVGFQPEEARRRAEDAIIAIQGSLIIARATSQTETFRRVLSQIVINLMSDAPAKAA